MSFQNNFKLRLNTNISNLSMSDVRLLLKNIYDEIEDIKAVLDRLTMEKNNNETRTISTDRSKVGRPSGKDVSTS